MVRHEIDVRVAEEIARAGQRSQVRAEQIEINGKTPHQVLHALELKIVGTKFVGPRIWLDEADRRQWAMDPRMLPGLAQKASTDLVYVGTVVNCGKRVAE